MQQGGGGMNYHGRLPFGQDRVFLTYCGMETDLIFSQGVDLPGFASYPLLETPDGRAHLRRYAVDHMALAAAHGVGAILETPTWVASPDRAAALGYGATALRDLNRAAVAFLSDLRAKFGPDPTLISANIGPRGDAYAPDATMTASEAEAYHAQQIGWLKGTDVDVISGYTFADVAEAIGLVRAATAAGFPVVIAFTVETDGRLPTGMSLSQAVQQVDAVTNGAAAFFMVNCAHPDHIAPALSPAPWVTRIGGIVANASRCSHAELDNATELDAGNPAELATQLAALRKRFAHITVFGGCCGTDQRHMTEIAKAVR